MGSPVAVYFFAFSKLFFASFSSFLLSSFCLLRPSFFSLSVQLHFIFLSSPTGRTTTSAANGPIFFASSRLLPASRTAFFCLTCFCQLQTASRTSSRLLPEQPVLLLFFCSSCSSSSSYLLYLFLGGGPHGKSSCCIFFCFFKTFFCQLLY